MRGWVAAAQAAPLPAPAGLTRRELEVVQRLAAGRTSKEIAAELIVSLLTVNRTSPTSTSRSTMSPA
jgi:DNA-binding CsgD family transcriptional regulator